MFRRKRLLKELDGDIAEHLERETQDYIARGMSPEEARYAAQRKFGNVTRVREDVRDVWTVLWFDHLLADVRFGLRMMRRSPGFTAVAVLTLALGIGANTYIFSMVDALLLHPMDFANPARLVALWERIPASGVERNELSPANFLDWQSQNRAFDHVAAQAWWDVNLGGVDQPEHLHGFLVTPDYFAALEAQPTLGRGFLPEEGTSGHEHVAILSYALWRDHFGSDATVLGRQVRLNGEPFTIVGVMSGDYNYPWGAQIWSPLVFTPQEQKMRWAHYLHAVGHLRSGVTLEQARADLRGITSVLAQHYPETNTGREANLLPLLESEVGEAKAPMLIMSAAVGLVLLIACANLSNLLLARASSRRREIAIRAALGAPRWRLVRQWLVESALLAVFGGILGVLLAFFCLHVEVIRVPPEFARMITGWSKVSVNTSALVFTSLLSIGTAFLFGLVPAMAASRSPVSDALKESMRSASAGKRRAFLRNTLIVAEIAVSLALLASAGLMVKSFVRLNRVSPGFNSDGVLTMFVTLPSAKYTSDQQTLTFYAQLLTHLERLPGVSSAAAANVLPLGSMNTTATIRIEGMPEPKPGEEAEANLRSVSPSYFRTMQIPVLRGREFTTQDTPTSQPVLAVNQAFAARFWPTESPLGKRVRFPGPLAQNPWYTVVALTGDVRNHIDRRPEPEMYFPLSQQPQSTMALVVRSARDPRSLAEPVRAEVLSLDRDLPVFQMMTMSDWRSVSVIPQRIGGTLMSAFAGFALLLASVGLFGVIAYSVSERTQEIGIRMALGAGRREVFRLVVGRGMLLTLTGVVLGLPLALGMGRAVAGLLYGVAPTDLATYAAVAVILSATALLACYVPARRAMRLDPVTALRTE